MNDFIANFQRIQVKEFCVAGNLSRLFRSSWVKNSAENKMIGIILGEKPKK